MKLGVLEQMILGRSQAEKLDSFEWRWDGAYPAMKK